MDEPDPADRPDPRWLSPEEQQAWRSLMGVVMWLPGSLETQLTRDAGLSHFEYIVLSTLSEVPDRTLRMSALATRADARPPRLSQVVGRLETRGWVTRRPDPSDGRSTFAVLTDSGLAKVREVAPGHADHVRRLVFDVITPEQVRALGEIAARIQTTVDPALGATR